jgi:hypothetical protein
VRRDTPALALNVIARTAPKESDVQQKRETDRSSPNPVGPLMFWVGQTVLANGRSAVIVKRHLAFVTIEHADGTREEAPITGLEAKHATSLK